MQGEGGDCRQPDAADVLRRAYAIAQDRDSVRRWYVSEPLSAFGGKTARELVECDGRVQDVLDYLGSIEAGPLA